MERQDGTEDVVREVNHASSVNVVNEGIFVIAPLCVVVQNHLQNVVWQVNQTVTGHVIAGLTERRPLARQFLCLAIRRGGTSPAAQPDYTYEASHSD
jgi:hypothetical protein